MSIAAESDSEKHALPQAGGGISFWRSLRLRLVALVLLASIPMAVLVVYNAQEARNMTVKQAALRLGTVVGGASAELRGRITSAMLMLSVLAEAPATRLGAAADCAGLLDNLARRAPRHLDLSLTVASRDGAVLCSSPALSGAVNLSDREYFKQVLATRGAVVGKPVISRISKSARLPIAHPILNRTGAVDKVVTAAVGLDRLVGDVMASPGLAGAVFSIWDANKTVLFRNPENARWFGTTHPEIEIANAFGATTGMRTIETGGLDGVRRVYALSGLDEYPNLGLTISLGLSADVMTAEGDRKRRNDFVLLTLILLIALAGAWSLGEIAIRQRIAALVHAALRIAGGHLDTRIGGPYRGGELDQLTFAFDSMAAAMQHQVEEIRSREKDIRDFNTTLEQRVADRTHQLEEANHAKSDFLANMSHELRTPLNSIIGFSEMLKDGLLGDLEKKQRGFVTDIFDAGTHLLSLINDILDLSKVEAGMLQLEPVTVDIAGLLKASTLVVREKALTHRIRLETDLDPGIGSMLADERKLKQIVYNLLSNAVKFTPEGGIVTLRARRCTRAEVLLDQEFPGRLIALPPGDDNEFLAITVVDSGVGIAREDLAKLFEPFVQVDSSVARRHAGTGLGLSLVRRLAELHGGTVGLASVPGKGSRFSVWLPCRAPASVQKTAPIAEIEAPAAPAVPLALVIEDDDWMAGVISEQLRAEGFEVMRSATAEEGLVRAAKRRPQLITLDIFLPAMDGWEFMRRLKADPKLADTPVVIISISEDLGRGVVLGARRVLQKPFLREELVAALTGLVAMRPNGEPARVLVVDDNLKAVELLATTLEAEGYQVMRAYGGAEAIAVARSAHPDLVILDLMMPDVSGFEVARALRESEDTARIQILVLTAKDLTAEDRARLNGNVRGVLTKENFRTSELLAELRRASPRRDDT